MMRGRVTPVNDRDLQWFRRASWIGWTVVIGGFPWVLAHLSPNGKLSLVWTITLWVVCVPLGWLLGYRWQIAPLFSGMVISPKKR